MSQNIQYGSSPLRIFGSDRLEVRPRIVHEVFVLFTPFSILVIPGTPT